MFPGLFNLYMDAVMKEMKMRIRRMGVRFVDEEREKTLAGSEKKTLDGFMSADDLVFLN